MALATFGAIMSFALELEEHIRQFYQANRWSSLEGLCSDILRATEKRIKRLERTRRESVAEMILEPIQGLEEGDYVLPSPDAQDDSAFLQRALELEKTAQRFYTVAAEKMPVREVSRVLERMGREHQRVLETLQDH